MTHLDTPAVHIDLDIVDRNIIQGVETLKPFNITHRPHIKVHKSVFLAKRQLELGCKGITCAKLGEAEVMADGGINDILLAYPMIGADKLERYGAMLRRNIAIRTIINNIEGAMGLSNLGVAMGRRIPVLIEIDGGINRGGVKLGEQLSDFARKVKDLPGLKVEGLEYYGGDIYALKTKEDIKKRAKKEADEVMVGAETLRSLKMDASILSAGSSYSLRFPEQLKGVTEVRAGNYIFNDGSQLSIGLISPGDCAMNILSTVVGRPDANSAIIDAGSKTLTSDKVTGWDSYGYVIGHPDVEIYKLNEEHGFLRSGTGIDWKVGDVIRVVPNHACVVPNLCDEIYGMRGNKLERVIAIEARGKNR